jgi:hypothetical protein
MKKLSTLGMLRNKGGETLLVFILLLSCKLFFSFGGGDFVAGISTSVRLATGTFLALSHKG